MDVLELPRPVINFLRTMAKESSRYVLSWDIFGGTDSVTLTLTWKLSNQESQSSISKSPQQHHVYDDLYIRHDDSTSSPRRSRREDNEATSTRARLSRGKSLEGNNLTSNKSVSPHQKQASSLERSSITNRPTTQSDSIYSNLDSVKYATISRPSTHTNHHSAIKRCESPIRRKFIPSKSINTNSSSETRRRNRITIQTDDDDENDDDDIDNNILDPWVKDFEYSLEDKINNTTRKSETGTIKKGNTSSKVKFKKKPDYF